MAASFNIAGFAAMAPTALNGWVDIIVIAIMIYLVLRLLVETRSLSVGIGIFALVVLYWLSALFNLPLTNLVLKTFFGFFVIFIAIIFQKELRRLFSFVGFFSFQRSVPPAQATIDTVVQAAAKMSAQKVGALIVFPGRESIARHFEKGISLRGDISQELLLSIFSEETPGHDGAVVIENNKIRRFGVHLPLAEDSEQVSRFGGLRHRAALGLSQHSDAFTLVVSGETGNIDVARDGAWEHCKDAEELRAKLLEFSRSMSPDESKHHFLQWVERNAAMFIVSLIIAFIAWAVYAPNFVPTQRNFTAPLEFQNVPAGYVVEDAIPRDAVVTLQGQGSDFESLSTQSLDVSIDLGSVRGTGQPSSGWITVPVTPADVDKPLNFSVIQVAPRTVQVDIVKQ